MTPAILPTPSVTDSSSPGSSGPLQLFFFRLTSGSPARWNVATAGGLFALIAIWAACLHATWAAWGSLTVDSGREIYVSAVLAEGKVLYRDVWYNFGPAAPYINCCLFRLFGVHLSVMYWAGSFCALGSAILLYLSGMRLSFSLAGWTAGAVLLFESFAPTVFSFPLPYSFAAVYGCLIACLFLWIAIGGAASKNRIWVFAAGVLAAVAVLMKFEFGVACYITLALLILARLSMNRSLRFFLADVAATLPGLLFCVFVIRWLISIGGFTFLTQENFQSWPGSYFMRTYGRIWLANTGFDFSAESLTSAAQRIFSFLAVFQGLHLVLTSAGEKPERRVIALRGALLLAGLVYLVILPTRNDVIAALFFPQDMVVYVGIAALVAWWCFWRRRESGSGAAIALIFTFSFFSASRILFKMRPVDYPVFYNGPVVLAFLLLVIALIPRSGHSRRFIAGAQWVICLACLSVAAVGFRTVTRQVPRPAWLTTERGSIRVSPQRAEQYQAAIEFMKEKAALGESVLSVPEDTSLYFLSETHCPTRVIAFTPGILAPGKMTDETIRQIEQNHVRYLIWSNRIFPEYRALRFGTDFDQTMGSYLTSHYRRVRPLTTKPVVLGEWNAYIWERVAKADPQ
jgi:hypothetical protein